MKQSFFMLVALLSCVGLHGMNVTQNTCGQQDVGELLKQMQQLQLENRANGIPPTPTIHIDFTHATIIEQVGAPVNLPVKIEDVLEKLDEVKQQQGITSLVDASEAGSTHGAMIAAATQTESPYMKCYFTPNIRAAFLNCIANEQKGMRGAWYRFTLYDAASAIAKGINEKNLTVQLVIDGDHFKKSDPKNSNFKGEFCCALKKVIDAKGIVYSMERPRFPQNKGNFETMHEKFMIFESVNGKKLLWNGSWNATGQGSDKNSENVMVTDNAEAIAAFENEYAILVSHSRLMPANECWSPRDLARDSGANYARTMNGMPQIH